MSAIQAPKLTELEHLLGKQWSAIAAARRRALDKISAVEGVVDAVTPTDTSLVVFGSVARGEVTSGSDIDWTLLIDGQAYPSHLNAALDLEDAFKTAGLKGPGSEGTFGGMSFSHDIVHLIGGQDDTNRNMTQRILLLLESRAIGDVAVYDRVKKQVLKRYVAEDFGLVTGNNPSHVPRFLLNDIVRYWRTVAVDFAYKRRERQAKGWALRTVKLRLSRKLTYVSGLVACFTSAAHENVAAEERVLRTVDRLQSVLEQVPLETVAGALLDCIDAPGIRAAADSLFSAYDDFLALIDDPAKRNALDALLPSDAARDPLYQSARETGHRFQHALNSIFLVPNGTSLNKLMLTYGVF